MGKAKVGLQFHLSPPRWPRPHSERCLDTSGLGRGEGVISLTQQSLVSQRGNPGQPGGQSELRHWLEPFHRYTPLGFHSLAEQTKLLRTSFDAGEKGDLQLRNLEVKIYHDNTAVVTGYVVGTRPSPDGIRVPIRDQRTEVWIKQGEQWKQVHRHSSPLLLPQ